MEKQKDTSNLLSTRTVDILSEIDDNLCLKDIKLIGSVHSLCQDMELQEQLLQGVRVLELDLNNDYALTCLGSREYGFLSVMRLLNQYFILHPREFFLLILNSAPMTSSSLFLDRLCSAGANLLHNENVRIGELRGKVWVVYTDYCSLLKGVHPTKEYRTCYEPIEAQFNDEKGIHQLDINGYIRKFPFHRDYDGFVDYLKDKLEFKDNAIYMFGNLNKWISAAGGLSNLVK